MKPVLFVMCCVVVTGQATWSDLNTQGIRFYARGQFGPAEVKFRAALVQAEQFEQSDYRLTANLSNLALVLQEQGDLAAAEKLYRRVLELREKYLKPESAEIAATLNNI